MLPAQPDDFPISDAEILRRVSSPEGSVRALFGGSPAEMRQLHDWSGARPPPVLDAPATFVLFVGYPRSGHSLVGALLDAHPEMAIAHELDVLRFRAAGFSRDQVLLLIAENSRRLGRLGRRWGRHDYAVPGASQGSWRRLAVIGDKKGGETTRRLAVDPAALEGLTGFLALPVRFIHVVRDPADNISTMFLRQHTPDGKDGLRMAIDYFRALARANAALLQRLGPDRCMTVWHEDFVADPGGQLTRLCRFLGVEAEEDYLRAAAGLVAPAPRRSRIEVEWPQGHRRLLERIMAESPFLQRYADASGAGRGPGS